MEKIISYDPLENKFPRGTISKNNEIKFCVFDNGFSADEVYLMMKRDDENEFFYHQMQRIENQFETTVKFETRGHFWYLFQVKKDGQVLYLSKTFDNYSYLSNEAGEAFFQLVTEKEYNQKNQLQGGIIYQIYVDRFCKYGEVNVRKPLIFRNDWGGAICKNTTDPLVINQEVFGGNFAGVESKLDYLKDLGVTTIYLNPISMANSNHKYDTADYMHVDPMFGTEADFERMVAQAKNRGIKVIIDGVYNHTGSDSIYFNKYNHFDTLGAYKSKKSKFYSWYNWINWPNEYGSWWGIDTLPSISHTSEDFQNYIAGDGGVIEKFLKQSVSGVRLDVVDEISDEFVKKIRNKVFSFGDDKAVIGEVWEDASTKISYSKRREYFSDNELTSVMNYPVKESILNYIRTKEPHDLVSTMRMLLNNYPKTVLDNLMNFLGTHDTGRFYSDIKNMCEKDEEKAQKLLKIATGILFLMPGVPSIFYGDEYGIENSDGNSRVCFDWKNYKTKVFDWYLKLTKIRKMPVLKDGEFKILFSKDGKFVFERFNDDERIVCLTNLKKEPLEIEIEGEFKSFITGKNVETLIRLEENEIEILIEKNKKKK